MLAWLQRITTFGLLSLAGGWAAWQWHAGRPVWGLAGAVLLVGGYALVLAVEFGLMHRVNRGDPAPRATPLQALQAWIGETGAAPAVFCWRQPLRSSRWPDHLPAAARVRGIVLIHGFVCNRGIWNRWYPALRAAAVPHVAVDLEPVFGGIDDYVPVIERAVRAVEAATGMAPVIVAHSMGGLALRAWWVEHAATRVHHAITIGSPHHGTWLARFAMSANGRQMRPGSPWLRALTAREPADRGTRMTCFFGHCDNIVFPASAALMPGAVARHLPAVAHVRMVDRPEPLHEALRLVGAQRPVEAGLKPA